MHTRWSDGRRTLDERVAEQRVRSTGVSDHYVHPGIPDEEALLRYAAAVRGAGLRVGIEYDLGVSPPLSPTARAALDYVIGSVHQVRLDGNSVGFDAAGEALKTAAQFAEADRFADARLCERILDETLHLVREAAVSDVIDIIGHPTLSPVAALGMPFPAAWEDELCALCARHGVALEVNESYRSPHQGLLRKALAGGVRLAVGSDSHDALKPLDWTLRTLRALGADEDDLLVPRI